MILSKMDKSVGPLYVELRTIFECANAIFLDLDRNLLISRVSERTLCGALASHIQKCLEETRFSSYHVDVEYNRNNGKIKTIFDPGSIPEPVTIQCDIIVHSRGENLVQDNLIAIEMKKSSACTEDKFSDRKRIALLTKDSFDDVWSYDGTVLPEHVCRYGLGIYYEINLLRRQIQMEFYFKGSLIEHISLVY